MLPSRLVRQDRADVEQRLRPDRDDADLDELVDRVAQQAGAMNTSATPVQRKNVARLSRREPW